MALGVLAICLGGLLSYVVYARVSVESSVLIMTETVYRGSVIEARDLAAVTVSGAAAEVGIPAQQASTLVGQTAVFDLVEGSIVPAGAIGPVVVPGPGRAVVGVRLVEGRAPVGLLHSGSVVRLVALPPDGAEPEFVDDYTGDAFTARVVETLPGSDGLSTLVNVDLPVGEAATVALLAAQDRLSVVRDFDGEG